MHVSMYLTVVSACIQSLQHPSYSVCMDIGLSVLRTGKHSTLTRLHPWTGFLNNRFLKLHIFNVSSGTDNCYTL